MIDFLEKNEFKNPYGMTFTHDSLPRIFINLSNGTWSISFYYDGQDVADYSAMFNHSEVDDFEGCIKCLFTAKKSGLNLNSILTLFGEQRKLKDKIS